MNTSNISSGSSNIDALRRDINSLETFLSNPETTKEVLDKIKASLENDVLKEKLAAGYSKGKNIYDMLVPVVSKKNEIATAKPVIEEKKEIPGDFDKYGLLGKQAFERYLIQEEAKVLNDKSKVFGVFYIDANGLKKANDRYCHQVGDEAIEQIKYSLAESIRLVFDEREKERRRIELSNPEEKRTKKERRQKKGYRITSQNNNGQINRLAVAIESDKYASYAVHRSGGDEFLIVMSGIEKDIDALARECYTEIAKNIEKNTVLKKVGMTVGCGIAKGKNLKELLNSAEQAAIFSKIIGEHSKNMVTYTQDEPNVKEYIGLSKVMEDLIMVYAAKPLKINNLEMPLGNHDSKHKWTIHLDKIVIPSKLKDYLQKVGALDCFLDEIGGVYSRARKRNGGFCLTDELGFADVDAARLNPGEKTIGIIYEHYQNLIKDKKKIFTRKDEGKVLNYLANTIIVEAIEYAKRSA